MSEQRSLHPYEAWLKLGHKDDMQNAERCKRCGMTFQEFAEVRLPRSCDEEKEAVEIARKKLQDLHGGDDYLYPTSRRY